MQNYKINVHKSEALNINLTPAALHRIQANFPFSWTQKKIKYLGIYLTPSLSEIFKENFLLWLTSTRIDLKCCQQTLTWFRRNSILKMTVLPRLPYLLQTLPVAIPHSSLHATKAEFQNQAYFIPTSCSAQREVQASDLGTFLGHMSPFFFPPSVFVLGRSGVRGLV